MNPGPDAGSFEPAAIAADLRRAASHRFLALSLSPPSAAVAEELRALAAEVDDALAEHAATLAEAGGPELQGLYHRLLGPSGRVPDVECAYDEDAVAGRGARLADIAAFYRAFAYPRFAEGAPAAGTPDHVATELDFIAWLHLKMAHARHARLAEALAITDAARSAFLRDHLGRWAMAFFERLAEAGEGTHYEALAAFAARALRRLDADAFDPPAARRRLRLPLADDGADFDRCG